MVDLPTERLTIDLRSVEDDDSRRMFANQQCDEFAVALIAAGKRPLFEVWYVGIRDAETGELYDSTEADFDALDYVGGVPVTLPSYPEGWTR